MPMYYPELVTKIVASILIIGFGIIIGGLLSTLTKKVLESFEIRRLLYKKRITFPIEEIIASFIKYISYFTGLVWGLLMLGLGMLVLYLVLTIILIVLVGFILLAFKDFIPNFIAGIIVHWDKKVKKGDLIQLDSTEGKVTYVGMLETNIKTGDGDIVIIPNVLLSRKVIVIKK